jgi:carbon monoxide dehydrogenase subunit G
MDIEGTYTLQATPDEVWQCLMDPQALQRAIPGVEHLEALDDSTFDITLHMQYAPLRGLYSGRIRIFEQQYPTSYRIVIEGNSRQRSITCEGRVHLSNHGGNTIISYTCSLSQGKPGLLLPAPLVRGTAKLFLQQFFSALAEYLRSLQPVSAGELDMFDLPANLMVEEVEVEEDIDRATVPPPTLLHRLIHLLRLGHGDAQAEEHWVQRTRRLGMVCGLLALVWVGTRLPRRIAPEPHEVDADRPYLRRPVPFSH